MAIDLGKGILAWTASRLQRMNRNCLLLGMVALGAVGALIYLLTKQNRQDQNEEKKRLKKDISRWENEGGRISDRLLSPAG
jgi:hypothetical protein